jgi:VCBS repeat-containing protein
MVGDDGAGNQVGVAPGAQFIAAKGCATADCSDAALLASAQWMLAPTDLSGANPRPDLRPDIVNNSWGGTGGDPWYEASVNAWVAAGIMPIFANGNSGPACGTAFSPGDYTAAYSVANYDINNVIAANSSRGPSGSGDTKPNIAAPGINVRSSVNGGGYANFTGPSMAAPHVAGTVALLWSASPALRGNLAATRALLDAGAVDSPDDQCGGTDDDNNVFGEGRLDAFATVSAALVNDAPVATNDGYSTNEDTTLTVAAPGVLGNDSDPDGNALTAALVAGPAHGSLTLNAAGSFTYTPAANFNGSDTFTYRPSDGTAPSNTATVSITVGPVNDAPTVVVAAGGVCDANDRAGTVNLVVADADSPVGSLVLSATSSNQLLVPTANVTFGGAGANRSATVTAVSKTGTSVISITVSDGQATASVTVTISVTGNAADTVTGTAGSDILIGQNGNDILNGLGANDLLCGGRGDDRLTGGVGADRFSGGQGSDIATDLTPAKGDTQDGTIP